MYQAEERNRLTDDTRERTGAFPSSWGHLAFALTLRAVLQPRLAFDLLGLAWAFRAHDWYRQAPFLPVPPPEYIRWRMYTAYGDEAAVPPVEDVVRFAKWRRKLLDL
jgi:hypothetical protein